MKKFKTIGDYSTGRNNNFDLIRFLAATMVLFAHSYPLSRGVKLEDPLARFTHFINFGGLGVYIFFSISGFLIARSYCSRQDIGSFAKGRILRIFPGLITANLVCAFIIGPLITTISSKTYLFNIDTLKYVLHNSLLYNIRYYLPGVFQNNPYPVAVNGSLWTLPVEFKMYILVAVIGIIGIIKNKVNFNIFLCSGAALYLALKSIGINLIDEVNLQMVIYFILGSLLWINRDHVPVHIGILLGAWFLTGIMFKTSFIGYIFPLTLTYTIFFIAFYPSIKLNNFGKYGDFSYGMYIYAFPVQQLVALKLHGIGPIGMFFTAFVITLILSVGSWKLIEKPAMNFKDKKFIELLGVKTKGVSQTDM